MVDVVNVIGIQNSQATMFTTSKIISKLLFNYCLNSFIAKLQL